MSTVCLLYVIQSVVYPIIPEKYSCLLCFVSLDYTKFGKTLQHPYALFEDDSCCLERRFVGGPLDAETTVEFSYYLQEIQLRDPTAKVPPAPIINHYKQSIDIALHTVTAPLMPAKHEVYTCTVGYITHVYTKSSQT